MAEGRTDVESQLSKAVKELAIKMRDEHGLCIRSIDINWLDVSAVGGQSAVIRDITITSTSPGE